MAVHTRLCPSLWCPSCQVMESLQNLSLSSPLKTGIILLCIAVVCAWMAIWLICFGIRTCIMVWSSHLQKFPNLCRPKSHLREHKTATSYSIVVTACALLFFEQIYKDWHLMIFTMTVAVIAFFLLLLGTAIPQLRGNVSQSRDIERPSGISVRD